MADVPLSEIVSLTITQNSVVIQRASYGIPLILSVNAAWAERVRVYSQTADVLADFASTSPEYLAAAAMFAQSPAPAQIMIGRAAGKPTQAYQINVGTVTVGANYKVVVSGPGITTTTVSYVPGADVAGTFLPRVTNVLTLAAHGFTTGQGPVRVSNSGGALPTGLAVDTNYWIIANTTGTFSFASSKANALALTPVALSGDGSGTQTIRIAENDVICAQLQQGLQAVVGQAYTVTQVTGAGETDYLTVTQNVAGAWVSLNADPSLLVNLQTHVEPSPALAVDLAAIQNENPNWYALYTLYNSDAYVKAAAAWVEANGKIYLPDICTSASATAAVTGGDTMDALHTLAYKRTAVTFHPDPSAMNGAAWLGARLPYDPGSENWKFANLPGVTPVSTTTTWRTNIRAKSGNIYITTAGRNIMVEGTMTDGGFIDTRRGLDFLQDDLTKSVFAVLASATKVPFTDAGIALVVNAMRASLKRSFGAGVITSAFSITFPLAASVSSTNKGLRILPNLNFSCQLQGAINKITIVGVVSV